MTTLLERARQVWDHLQSSERVLPARVAIDPARVIGAEAGAPFRAEEDYFVVRINEMYLTRERQWFEVYDPLVFVVSEFIYNKETETIPFVVGPNLLEKLGQRLPNGMIFSDTRVAGLHPYRGGQINLSVILCRVQRDNYARKLLRMVENAAGALDFSTALSTYVKIAGIVLDGVESVLDLGGTVPLVGQRKEFSDDSGALQSGFFALIDRDEAEVDPAELWVRDNQLVYGPDREHLAPYRQADFVLYSMARAPRRTDLSTLAWFPLYEQVIKDAMVSTSEDRWRVTKAQMVALAQAIRFSPDLTPGQAAALRQAYIDEMVREHDLALSTDGLRGGESGLGLSTAAPEDATPSREASELSDLLDL